MDEVRVDWAGHVAHVVLSRPGRINAINAGLIDGLIEAGRQAATRPDCRVVVMSGSGRGFCSGIDLDSLREASGGGGRSIDIVMEVADGANAAQHAVMLWRQLPVPVIAAVHGAALGGGLQIALGADIRVVHPQAKLSLMEVKWGLVPDMGGIPLLRDLLAHDELADLIFTGRVFDGAEALRLGLATRLSEAPLEAAMQLAEEIASKSPDAVRAAKRLMTMQGTLAERLRAEAHEQRTLFGTANQREAVAAGMSRRPPLFNDAESLA
jgi:enoyl-CoA hydratase/carnithine racemase